MRKDGTVSVKMLGVESRRVERFYCTTDLSITDTTFSTESLSHEITFDKCLSEANKTIYKEKQNTQ